MRSESAINGPLTLSTAPLAKWWIPVFQADSRSAIATVCTAALLTSGLQMCRIDDCRRTLALVAGPADGFYIRMGSLGFEETRSFPCFGFAVALCVLFVAGY